MKALIKGAVMRNVRSSEHLSKKKKDRPNKPCCLERQIQHLPNEKEDENVESKLYSILK